jgi:hypothetical protein
MLRRGSYTTLRFVKDYLLLAVLVLSFATVVTVHVAIAARLVLARRPRWRGLIALAVPPLAPLWAYREGWRRSATLWLAGVLAYLVGRIASL